MNFLGYILPLSDMKVTHIIISGIRYKDVFYFATGGE
jgi:hypothetical protein